MPTKDRLTQLLTEAEQPAIRRGQGIRLSTDAPQPEAEGSSAKTHDRTSAKSHQEAPVRVNRGYKLREDLITACKHRALEEGRHLYQVMEDALSEYLQRHGKQ